MTADFSRIVGSLVVVKGGGDLASGVIYRLVRAGFPVMVTELAAPLFVRRTVAFGEAVYQREIEIEGITAQRVSGFAEAVTLAGAGVVPVVVDPAATVVAKLQPAVVVDGIMAKLNTGTQIDDAPLVVALGPGFQAGVDCHAVIETMRGHWLGRVLYAGSAAPDTGTPGVVAGRTLDRVLRAPAAGHVIAVREIGDRVARGELIATVKGVELRAAFDGVLRGIVHPAVAVTQGMKIGDLDPRGIREHCFTISDKSLAIGGGVLEAVLAQRRRMRTQK
jgi:xanthine dehydrogenase accessory factor